MESLILNYSAEYDSQISTFFKESLVSLLLMKKKGDSYIVTLSAFEIYQEKLFDLFDK